MDSLKSIIDLLSQGGDKEKLNLLLKGYGKDRLKVLKSSCRHCDEKVEMENDISKRVCEDCKKIKFELITFLKENIMSNKKYSGKSRSHWFMALHEIDQKRGMDILWQEHDLEHKNNELS